MEGLRKVVFSTPFGKVMVISSHFSVTVSFIPADTILINLPHTIGGIILLVSEMLFSFSQLISLNLRLQLKRLRV